MDRRDMGSTLAVPLRNRVRELRAALGWSQTDLAARLKVSRQTINAIENLRYDPGLPLASAIAKLLGRPVEAIFGDGCSSEATSSGAPP
jgi:putative transcriptional regulator